MPQPRGFAFNIPVEQPEPPIRPHVTAQVMELTSRLMAYHATPDTTVGDLVVEREGLGCFQDHCRTDMPMMITRILDVINDEFDRVYALRAGLEDGIDRPDCVVAWISDDGARLCFQPHSRRLLRKFVS